MKIGICQHTLNETNNSATMDGSSSFTATLSYFVSAWKQVTSSEKPVISVAEPEKNNLVPVSLSHFISCWQSLSNAIPDVYREVPPLTCGVLQNFIQKFAPALEKLRATGIQANVWAIAGLSHDEVRIASVLNWLLDPYGDHGQGSKICEKLLARIEIIAQSSLSGASFFPKESDLRDDEGCVRYRATTEVCPSGTRENRVDIVLDGEKLLLYIEVKIDAPQGEGQLQRYHDVAQKCAGGRLWGVVYLTPKGVVPSDASHLENCVAMSWRDIAFVLHQYELSLPFGHLARHFIGQFSRYVSNF